MSTTLSVELADRLVDAVVEEPRVRALWIEAATPRELRRPFDAVTFHFVADQPDFQSLVDSLEQLLDGIGAKPQSPRWSDTPRCARQLVAQLSIDGPGGTLGGERTFVVECSAFLAKRPRRAVAPLVDKTNHLTHVMTFERGP